MTFKYLLPLLLILISSCDKSNSVDIPYTSDIDIQIDGLFDNEKWNNYETIQLTPNNSLYLAQNKDYLFLGINNKENVGRYVDLYLENESIGIVNLHASMQLGERKLIDSWNDTIPAWSWGNNNGWTANVVEPLNKGGEGSFLASVKPYQGHEFQISKKKIKDKKLKIRLEIKDFIGQAEDIIFPVDSKRNETENWLKVVMK